VRYRGIVVEGHDILVAEGAGTESYVDDDNRGIFQNAGSYAELYPEAARRVEAMYCAPAWSTRLVFEPVRRRAERLGLLFELPIDLGALEGEIESLDTQGVRGWAKSGAFPDAPVCLEVRAGGELLGYAYANKLRADGRRGFALRFPGCRGGGQQSGPGMSTMWN
jgi:hypothetical protein